MFLPPPQAHTQPCVGNNSEHADNADDATTVPISTNNSRQHHHASVAYPYAVHCATYRSTAAYVQQQTDYLVGTRTSLGKVTSSPRGTILNRTTIKKQPSVIVLDSKKQPAVDIGANAHERGLLYLSDNRSPAVPYSAHVCDEVVVKGNDWPSWRGSLVVKFNIWLNKTKRVTILKRLIPIRNEEKKNINQPR